MFGYPAMFVGGNYATGLYEESWVVRLGAEDLDALLARRRQTVQPDARPLDEGLGRACRSTSSRTMPRSTYGWRARSRSPRSLPPKG